MHVLKTVLMPVLFNMDKNNEQKLKNWNLEKIVTGKCQVILTRHELNAGK